jgi:GntR family transcriptional regulator, transcriptional repressor for pyruvate dehydrogenase complex
MNIEPIIPKRLSQSIIEQFVQFVVNDDLKAGDRLPSERELASRFNVSRPSLREALRVLEIIGLVEIRPGGGTFVSDLNITPFLSVMAPLFIRRQGYEIEFLELRIMLELKAAELAARSPREDKEALLLPAVLQMKEVSLDSDAEEGVRADINFHRAIYRLADSFLLEKTAQFVVDTLEYSVSHSRKIIIERIGTTEELYLQHKAICDAICSDSPGEAKQAMEQHLRYTLGFYLDDSPQA